MKRTALAAGLLVLIGIGPVGCKSASSLAWWKNNKGAESTAIAHSAPTLPSDAAKKAEARQMNAAQLAGGEAAPYKPTAAPAGAGATSATTTAAAANYPQTSAPAFTPSTTGQVAATTPAAPTSTGSLGSVAMPYDPSKAPQAKSTAAVAAAAPTVDRYGMPLANVAATAAPASSAAAAPAYGQPPSDVAATTMASTTTPAFDPGVHVEQAVAAATGSADRYTSTAAASPYTDSRYGVAPEASTGAPGSLPSTTTASVVASAPYRPGGTSSYPGSSMSTTLQPGIQVASRPSTTTTPAAPNVAVPSAPTTQPVAPSRY